MANEEKKYEYKPYQESEQVRQYLAALQGHDATKPGEYSSQWQSQLDDIWNKIQNREPFRYDLNGDALYQQYKNQYIHNGKLAMADTMGKAAAMTGGYGSSYGQQVGQQTYQGYLNQLNDKVPELYQLALDTYQRAGDELTQQYSMLGQREAQDYARYQDALSAWNADRSYLAGRYDNERSYDYGRYTDDRNLDYQRYRDEQADAQWKAQFDEAKRQWDLQWEQSQAAASYSGGSGGGGGGGGSRSSGSSSYKGLSNAELNALEKYGSAGNLGELQRRLENYVSAGKISSEYAMELLESYYSAPKKSATPTKKTSTPRRDAHYKNKARLEGIDNGWIKP